MSCSKSFTGNSCGFQGTCVNETCVCNTLWDRSLDFVFEESSANSELLQHQPCNQSVTLTRGLYGILAMLSVGLIILHLAQVQRKSQLKRLLPLLITYGIFLGFSVYKLFLLTLFLDTILLLLYLEVLVFYVLNFQVLFFSKYIDYQLRQRQLKPWIIGKMKKGKVILKLVFLIDCTVSLLFFLSSIVSKEKASNVFRSGLYISSIRALSAILGVQYLASLLIQDMKAMVRLLTIANKKTQFMKRIKSIQNIRVHVIWFNLYMLTMFILGATFSKFLSLYSYFFPILVLLGYLMSFLVVWNYQQDRLLKSKSRSKETKNTSYLQSGSQILSIAKSTKKSRTESNVLRRTAVSV